ncbi:MAG: hypothetical protein MUF73_18475 [Rhodobacteraceae bacterium]|jgi:hypothetical protein|nr:hypothetical protein [Paracoccaceae bacterium]
MPTRRQTLALALGAFAMPHIRPSSAQAAALVFDPAAARTQEIVVDTATGPRAVTDRIWQSVPSAFRAVDARTAPILLANSMGGDMPSSVAHAAEVGAAGLRGPMGPPPGAGGAALKAAVRFLRANAGRVPDNAEAIVSSGTSAGGALSALLGTSGDVSDYADPLAAIGAPDASDAILATGAWCPVTDLEHADMAHEWCWGAMPVEDGLQPAQAISAELAAGFPAYQAALGLTRPDGTPLTADTYPAHLIDRWLVPAATAHLAAMTDADRDADLTANPAIGWDGTAAVFDRTAFRTHAGTRKIPASAVDAPDLSTGENNLFGKGPTRARHWWLRTGARDTDTSHTVVGNLDAALRRLGDRVNTHFHCDARYGANEDADAFLTWIATVTGHLRT